MHYIFSLQFKTMTVQRVKEIAQLNPSIFIILADLQYF